MILNELTHLAIFVCLYHGAVYIFFYLCSNWPLILQVADPFRAMFSPRALSHIWRANRKDSELYWAAYRQFVRNVQVGRKTHK
jgi:hypothetical protein